MNAPGSRAGRRARWWIALAISLVVASHVWIAAQPPEPLPEPAGSVRATLGTGPHALSVLRWSPDAAAGAKLPVVLLHGSPGDATNLADLALRLAADGREALAPDLPGFGGSAETAGGRSIQAHARAMLDVLPWRECHVVAWSMGGGVALHMAQLAPERVRSLTLVGSIGVQEAEGSGSWAFEHVKYALLWTLAVPVTEILPHFGLLGSRAERAGFCRNFWESDQRPLRGILAALETPVLVAHGRSDFLVPLWCAEESHALLKHSRLVVFEGSHFVPLRFGQLDVFEPELAAFLARHDEAGAPEPRARVDRSEAERTPRLEPYALPRRVAWWIQLGALALFAGWRSGAAGVAVGALAAQLQLDLGLGLVAGLLGASGGASSRRAGARPSWWRALARFLGGTLAGSVLAARLVEPASAWAGAWGGFALALALPLLATLLAEAVWRRARRASASDVRGEHQEHHEHEHGQDQA